MLNSRRADLLAAAACLAALAAVAWLAGLLGGGVRPGAGPHGAGEPTPEQFRAIQARVEAKTAVIDRLLSGEVSLLEAAAWFRQLNDSPPEYPSDFRERCPGDGDGEKACRQVITWLETRARWDGGAAALAAARYRSELYEMLARGAVELPW